MSSKGRLLRDLREWYGIKDSVFTISAEPLETNIYEWHANISPIDGPYKDCILHIILEFPNDYPNTPPKCGQYLNHPNIFNNGSEICLDMLKCYTTSVPYQGWTPGYSVTSVLLQLQSFLFTENITQSSGKHIKNEEKVNKDKLLLRCGRCGHNKNNIWPALNPNRYKQMISNQNNIINDQSLMKKYNNKLWNKLSNNVEKHIFEFLSVSNLMNITNVCKRFKYLVSKSNVLQMNKYECWYHRQTLSVKNNIISLALGYGINVEFYETIEKKTKEYNESTGKYDLVISKLPFKRDIFGFRILKNTYTSFDLLSSIAFETYNIRQSFWKDFKFKYFIPIYINNTHSRKALFLFETFVFNIYKTNDSSMTRFDPMMGINVIISIINTLIVNLLKTCENNSSNIPLHYSNNIIKTFFHYYHLLLGYFVKYKTNLEIRINDRIGLFLADEKYRNKEKIPNLDEIKILFTLTNKYKWDEMYKIWLQEAFTRQCKWILRDYPFLFKLEHPLDYSCIRLNLSFDKSLSSYRLFMFEHFFLNECCYINSDLTVANKLKIFNDNLGTAPLDLPVKLQNECKRILKCKNYKELFGILNLACPSNVGINGILCKSIINSETKGYHTKEEVNRSKHFKSRKEQRSDFYDSCSNAVERNETNKCICGFKRSNKINSNNSNCHYNKKFYSKESGRIRKGFSLYNVYSRFGPGKEIPLISHSLRRSNNASVSDNVSYANLAMRSKPRNEGGSPFNNSNSNNNNSVNNNNTNNVPRQLDIPNLHTQKLMEKDLKKKSSLHKNKSAPKKHPIANNSTNTTETDSDNWRAISRQRFMRHGRPMVPVMPRGLFGNPPRTMTPNNMARNMNGPPTIMNSGTYNNPNNNNVKRPVPRIPPMMTNINHPMQNRHHPTNISTSNNNSTRVNNVSNNDGTRVSNNINANNSSRVRNNINGNNINTIRNNRPSNNHINNVSNNSFTNDNNINNRSNNNSNNNSNNLMMNRRIPVFGNNKRSNNSRTVNRNINTAKNNVRNYQSNKKRLPRTGKIDNRQIHIPPRHRNNVIRNNNYNNGLKPPMQHRIPRLNRNYNNNMMLNNNSNNNFNKNTSNNNRNNNSRNNNIRNNVRNNVRNNNVNNNVSNNNMRNNTVNNNVRNNNVSNNNVSNNNSNNSPSFKRPSKAPLCLRNRLQNTDKRVLRPTKPPITKPMRPPTNNNNYKNSKNNGFNMNMNRSMNVRHNMNMPPMPPNLNTNDNISKVRPIKQPIINTKSRTIINSNNNYNTRMNTGPNRNNYRNRNINDNLRHNNNNNSNINNDTIPRLIPMTKPLVTKRHNYNRNDLVYSSALCIIPPQNVWQPIQEIRSQYDQGFKRWMPHMNILYPFIDSNYFTQELNNLKRKLKLVKKFKITLNSFSYFNNENLKKLHLFLCDNNFNTKKSFQFLHNVLAHLFPLCKNRNFSAHLTVGQFHRNEITQYRNHFSKNWKRISFICDHICIISRPDEYSPFTIKHKLYFDSRN